MSGLLAFNLGGGPCLRWKLVATVKLQWGWPGFSVPYTTRYLSKLVTISVTPTFDYGTANQAPTAVSSSQWNMDHYGNVMQTILAGDGADADFPYTSDITPDPTHSESWAVSDSSFTHVYNDGYDFTQTEVQLSNPYTTAMLDADAQAFLNAADVKDQPWQTWQTAGEITSPFFVTIPNAALPPQVRNADQSYPGPAAMAALNSAAWYAYTYGEVSNGEWFPNGYMKCIGYVAMAGNYCEKTFIIDPGFNVLNETCASGVGSCSNEFTVTPPALTPGQNAYVTITPNCQCGG
jgi:hypothetical protein